MAVSAVSVYTRSCHSRPGLNWPGLARTGVLVAVVVARFSLICTQQRSPILHVARCTLPSSLSLSLTQVTTRKRPSAANLFSNMANLHVSHSKSERERERERLGGS